MRAEDTPQQAAENDPTILESGMRTGQAADDEPEMAIADKHAGESPADANGDGRLTVKEAEAMLSGKAVDQNASATINSGAPVGAPTTE